MTEAQLLIVIFIGIVIDNARLNDVKDTLRAERKVLESSREKIHSEMLHRVGDLDTHLTRIENGLGMNRG